MQVIPKNKFLLSICIPTYNNPQRLLALLDWLSGEELDDVEIVVRDDSPSDDTETVVKKYTHLPIKYFHGAQDGYDAAILFLTDKAQGKYLWWFGDDLMADGIILKIKELITKHLDLTFIWLNSRSKFDSNFVGFNIHEDKFFKDGNEIIETNLGLLAFGSATVVKKERVNPFMQSAFKYKSSSLMTFYLTLGAISSGGSFYLVSYPYIICEPKPLGESRWYDSFQVHGINMFVITQEFKDKFDRNSLRKGLAGQFGYIWRAVIVERALGFETGFANRSSKVWKMTKSYWSYPEFYVALPLMLLPRPVLRPLYVLYKGIRNLLK
jgi:glycosyltransferase involved in cell wall biosynthesis